MNLTTEYEVSPEMQKASVQAHYFHGKMKWTWVIILTFIIVGVLICQFHQVKENLYIGIGLATTGGVLLLATIKTYFTNIRAASDILNLDDDNIVTLTFTEENIITERASSKQQIKWAKITHIIEAGDFVILQAGKLPVATLPKKHLSEEQMDFIKSHAINGAR